MRKTIQFRINEIENNTKQKKKNGEENYDVLHVYHFAVTYFIAFFLIFIAPFPCKIENIVCAASHNQV